MFAPKNVVIYSVGLLGGSIGLGLKHSGFKGRITGISSETTLPRALELGCIDKGYSYGRLAYAVRDANIVFLCSPINAIKKAIGDLSKIPLPKGIVITDVGSTKRAIVEHADAELPRHVSFIGGHPMAGSERNGVMASDPYLFENAVYVLTCAGGIASENDRELARFLEHYLGCRTLFLDPLVHDRIVAAVSHVPHLLAVALVNAAEEVENTIPGTLALAAGGFRDMTRIAGAPYTLWRDILATNKEAIEPFLDLVIARLDDMKTRLRDGTLDEYFESSRKTRSRIPTNAKGFIRLLAEVLVVVKDQPGIIAGIASALAEKNININDIEMLKVREGEGGTIRLAFDGRAVARAAVKILQKAGYNARERN